MRSSRMRRRRRRKINSVPTSPKLRSASGTYNSRLMMPRDMTGVTLRGSNHIGKNAGFLILQRVIHNALKGKTITCYDILWF